MKLKTKLMFIAELNYIYDTGAPGINMAEAAASLRMQRDARKPARETKNDSLIYAAFFETSFRQNR